MDAQQRLPRNDDRVAQLSLSAQNLRHLIIGVGRQWIEHERGKQHLVSVIKVPLPGRVQRPQIPSLRQFASGVAQGEEIVFRGDEISVANLQDREITGQAGKLRLPRREFRDELDRRLELARLIRREGAVEHVHRGRPPDRGGRRRNRGNLRRRWRPMNRPSEDIANSEHDQRHGAQFPSQRRKTRR